MKNILFISEEYFPLSNATVICISNIINELSKKNRITVYSLRNRLKYKSIDCDNNITIKRSLNIFDYPYLLRQYLIMTLKNIPSKTAINIIVKIIKLIFQPFVILSKKYGLLMYGNWSRNLKKFIIKTDNISNYDCVIAVGAPFNNVKSAIQLKKDNPKIDLILILFDMYALNPVLVQKDRNIKEKEIRLIEEEGWIKNSDFVFVTNEMYPTMTEIHKFHIKKIYEMNTPIFSIKTNTHTSSILENNFNNKNTINMVYAGTLNKDIRNPTFMLEILKLIININKNIVFHYIGIGCEDIFECYINELGNNIIMHGKQSKEYVDNILSFSDVFINISNKSAFQAPSKVIEYIGYFKPIINFYSIETDLSKEILIDYPLKIDVFENNQYLKESAKEVLEFISTINKEKINKDEITLKYWKYSPQHFAEMFEKVVFNYDKK